eukprot:15464428-Alexandrium_andersonii.AAC.1
MQHALDLVEGGALEEALVLGRAVCVLRERPPRLHDVPAIWRGQPVPIHAAEGPVVRAVQRGIED